MPDKPGIKLMIMAEEKLQQTPSQTVGPFFAYSLTAEQYSYDYNSIVNGSLISNDTAGERIRITGRIFDGNGNTISDAMIELWQADANGNYRTLPVNKKNDGFTGFGRLGTGTNDAHSFTFETIKPGAVSGQSPHVNVILFMRGSLHALYTRIYFSDEANDHDSFLNAVDNARRQTLIAERKEVNGMVVYQFNIYMQGEKETIFFQV